MFRRRFGRRVYKRRPQAIRRRRLGYKMRRRFMRGRKPMARTGGYGRIKFVWLRYTDEITLNATAAATDRIAFRANGIYDPYVPVGGHQPMGFDTWTALYARWAVLKSRCYMRYINTNNESAVPAYFTVAVTATGSAYNGVATGRLLENNLHGKIRVAGDTDVANEGFKNTSSMSWNCKKWYHKSPIGDANLSGDISADPTQLCFFECVNASINGNEPAGHNFLVTLYYYVAFYDPLEMAQS